ncbi:MAG TPA: hypothetical protein VFD41_14735 [Actinomycetales bacterium]|nr:hypothetical protein [Actinomycetales bacterium]
MTRGPSLRTLAAAAALATLSVTLTATPAAARPDAGGGSGARSDSAQGDCSLSRVDRQLVRCDHLTGAGVAAPLSVPEQ